MIFRCKFRVHGGGYPGKYSYNVAEGTTLLVDQSFRPVTIAGEARYGFSISSGVTSVELLQPGARWNGVAATKPVQVRPGHLLSSDGVSVEILDCPATTQSSRDATQFLDLATLTPGGEAPATGAPAVTAAQENVPLASFEGQGVSASTTTPYEVPGKVIAPVSLAPSQFPVQESPSRFGIAPLPAGADPGCDTDTEAVPADMLVSDLAPAASSPAEYETVHEPVQASVYEDPNDAPRMFTSSPVAAPEPAPQPALTPDFSATRPSPAFYPSEEPMRARENTLRRAAIIACTFVVLIVGAHYTAKHFPIELFDDQDGPLVVTFSRVRPRSHPAADFNAARTPASAADAQQAANTTLTPVSPLPVEPPAPPAPKAPSAEDLKAFTEAVDSGNMTVVVRMIDNELVSPDYALDPLGRSPFLRAAASGRVTAMQYLLSKKVSTTATDYNGNTALMWSVINGHEKTVKFLLGLGLDASTKREDGKDSYALAREYHQGGLVKLFREQAKANKQSDDRKPASR